MYLSTKVELRNPGMDVSWMWEDNHSVPHCGSSGLILGKFVKKLQAKSSILEVGYLIAIEYTLKVRILSPNLM